jgi:hypothetical protein
MIGRASLFLLAVTLSPALAAAQAPTQEQLGVPTYPGAQYQAQMSAGMSQPTEKYYIFTTGDPLARVLAFYENATQKKGQPLGEGGAMMIVLEGQAPFPKHGIMIEPNRQGMFPASVVTVVTVRREVPSPDGE